MKSSFAGLGAGLLALFAGACANTVAVPVEYAPRVAGAERIYSLSVLDFEGPDGHVFADIVESELVSARFRGAPAVSVVEPGLAGARYRRGRYRGAYSPVGLAGIGERLDVDAVVSGAVLTQRVDDTAYTREEDRCVSREEDGDCLEYEQVLIECWTVRADVDARIILVETAGARVLFNDILNGDSYMRYCADEPLPYTSQELVVHAMLDAAEPVSALFLPHERIVHATFARADETMEPGLREAFEAAYQLTGQNRYGEACSQWAALEAQGADSAILLYNLGVCAEMSGDLHGALDYYSRALARSPEEFRDALEGRERVLAQIEARRRIDG